MFWDGLSDKTTSFRMSPWDIFKKTDDTEDIHHGCIHTKSGAALKASRVVLWLRSSGVSHAQHKRAHYVKSSLVVCCVVLVSDRRGTWLAATKLSQNGCEFVIASDLVWTLPWHFSKLCPVTKEPGTWGLPKLQKASEDFSVSESSLLSNNKTSVSPFYLCLISTALKLTRNSWPWAECKLLSMRWLPRLQIKFNIRSPGFLDYLLVVTIMV